MSDAGMARLGRAREQGVLRLRQRGFAPQQLLVMEIINRTPDSFCRPGLT